MAEDELPDGWRWLSTWDTRTGEQHTKCGPSGDYARLLKASAAQKIRAYKQDSSWAVHVGDATAFLEAAKGVFAAKHNFTSTPAADQKLISEDLLAALVRLAVAAERIAEAAESMATVPQSFR